MGRCLGICRALEINRRHPIIHRLAEMLAAGEDEELTAAIVDQSYESALLLEGLRPDLAGILPCTQKIMAAAVGKAKSG